MFLKCLSQAKMWNDIELLLNDDTGQLLVGLGHECGTALYQVDTRLQITSSEKVQPIKAVASIFLNNYLGLFVMFSVVFLCVTTFPFAGLCEPSAPRAQLQGWQHCCCRQICGTSGQHWAVSSDAHSVW